MKSSRLGAAIGGFVLCFATALSAPTVTTDRNGVLDKNQTISFALNGNRDNFTLTLKFQPRFSEAHFGHATPLFKIVTGRDTLTVSPGIDAFGSFEPSTFIEMTLNGDKRAKFTEKDDLIKEGKEVILRINGNQATGLRFFVNNHPADFTAWQTDTTADAITIMACRDLRYNLIEFDNNETAANLPCLSIDEIIERLPDTAIAPAGLYTWLDRENDPQRAQPGGFYKLAVIPDDEGGYDIIYLDGASVNRDSWKAGMLKGKLKKTVFIDHYDLVWYDSNHEPLSSETFCTFIDGTIMQLDFPLYSTRMRFSRLTGSASTLIPTR